MRKIIFLALIILIGINFFYVLSGVLHYPLYHIDVYSIWMLKAKAFYIYHSFPLQFLKSIDYSHPQYPILLPFLLSLIYSIVGGVKELSVLIIYPVIYLLILYLAYRLFIKLKISNLQALFFTYLYSMFSPLLAQAGRRHAGMADIWITLICWLMLYFSYAYFREKKDRLLLLISTLVMFVSQIKFEGLFLVWLILFLPINVKKKLFWLLLSSVPAATWVYLRSYLNITSDFNLGLIEANRIIPEIITVVRLTAKEMLNIRNWYVFWIAFFIILLIQKTQDKFISKIIEPTLILTSLSFILTYLLIQLDTAAQVSSSVDRIMLQLSPLFYTIFVDRARLFFNQEKKLVRVLNRNIFQ